MLRLMILRMRSLATKSATYTPVTADNPVTDDDGKYLKAIATYTDRTYDENNEILLTTTTHDFVPFMQSGNV